MLCLLLALTGIACDAREEYDGQDVDPGKALSETDADRIIPVTTANVAGTGALMPVFAPGRAIFTVSNPGLSDCLFTLIPLNVDEEIEILNEVEVNTSPPPGPTQDMENRPAADDDEADTGDDEADAGDALEADARPDMNPRAPRGATQDPGSITEQDAQYLHQSNLVEAGGVSTVTAELTLGIYEVTCASQGRTTQPTQHQSLGARLLILVTEEGMMEGAE